FPNKSMLNETSLSFRNDKNTGIVTQRLLSLTRLSDISPVASLNATIVDGLFSKWGFIASSGILFEANSNGSLKAPSYGLGTITGIPTYGLAVDANGYLIETTLGGTAPTGLESITEDGKTGFRLIGRDPAQFGDTGQDAVDFGTYYALATQGARGQSSFNIGED